MPLFDYSCKSCGHVEEVLQKRGDPAPNECPACGEKECMSKDMSLPSFQLKGGGWYKDLYSSQPKDGGKDGKSKSAKNKDGGKSDKKSESKTSSSGSSSSGSSSSGSSSSGSSSSGSSSSGKGGSGKAA